MADLRMLPAETGDISCLRGDTFACWIKIIKDGVEENVTSSTWRMQVRNGNVLVIELNSSGGGITADVLGGGVLILRIAADVMANLAIGSFRYDMQQTLPDGTVQTRFKGTFNIVDDITKPV